tara:strand:- start:119 stop:1666 length:1548 start_codon:yes stop_codon:yes gene_type:complete
MIILSVFAGTLIWRNKHLSEMPKFNEKTFTTPVSSSYIPTNADLIFHWKINPTILPNYIENYQDKVNKNITNKKISFIRDSSLKLISLDFAKDISNWAGDYGSFAILNSKEELLNNWLMVLAINNNINIEEDLESILDRNIIEENSKNNTLRNSKSKIISKKINPTTSIYFAKDKENILISSNPKTIESSTKKLDNNTLDTKETYKNIQLKNNLKDGILLLEMSPKNIFNLIGQKNNLLELNQTNKLISSINIDNKKLELEGILSYDIKNKIPINDDNYNLIGMEKELELFDNFIWIDKPNQYFGEIPSHPYQRFIATLIKNSSTSDYSNLFKIILEKSKGNIIWTKDKDWLVLTSKSDTNKKEISNILKREKFLNSNLEFQNKNLEIWSKISTNENKKYEIKENIEAIIEENEGTYIWSQNLSSISNFDTKINLQNNLKYEKSTDETKDFYDAVKIHLGKEKTGELLNNFYPYILLKTMLGNKLNFPQNIDLSVEIPTINYPDFIKFKLNLKTS